MTDRTGRAEMAIIGLGWIGGGMIRRSIRRGDSMVGCNRNPGANEGREDGHG